MRVDIGNNLSYFESSVENTLPSTPSSYESIFTAEGRGQLVEASFKFDSEKILVRMVVNGENNIDINCQFLKDYFNAGDGSGYSSIFYNKDSKILTIRFPLSIQYASSIEFLAKNSEGSGKKLVGYQIIINEEA